MDTSKKCYLCWTEQGEMANFPYYGEKGLSYHGTCPHCRLYCLKTREGKQCYTSTLGEKTSPSEDTANLTGLSSDTVEFLCRLNGLLYAFCQGSPAKQNRQAASKVLSHLATLLTKE